MNLTTRLRDRLAAGLPLAHLLPDRLPAFVRSPAYFFGVVTLSSLVLLIVSGIALSAFGPQWWHDSAVGHFVNSLHFWCAQIFFFALTLHLWTEFFKGAWRHGRRWTWVSGSVTFLAGLGTAFTGYLSQTNFDAQWIAVQGKDAMNSIALGAFFNLLNFGQMYGFHVLILPLFVVLLVGIHLVQVRSRGVVRPYARDPAGERETEIRWGGPLGPGWSPWFAGRGRQPAGAVERVVPADQARYYRGIRLLPYDLVREGIVAVVAIAILGIVLAGVFSSPDDPPLTLQSAAQQDPAAFLGTATGMISGTTTLAQYGPPYNTGTGSTQYLGPISLEQWAGVTLPIDTAETYVLGPLAVAAAGDPQLARDLAAFKHASPTQQVNWQDAYAGNLDKGTVQAGKFTMPPGDYGPYGTMMDRLLTLGNSGALDGQLLRSKGFYQNDFTKPLLFLGESALPTQAQQMNLLGSQWGMMNETHNYPGQTWLWLYTFWYQIAPYNTSANADALVLLTMGLLTLGLVIFPFIPYLNRLPYHLGVHRLIWREYYHDARAQSAPAPEAAPPGEQPARPA